MSRNFSRMVKLYGWYSAVRMLKNTESDFITAYVTIFNKMPRKI